MNSISGLLSRLWRHARARPGTSFLLSAAVIILTDGVWSCQSTPSPRIGDIRAGAGVEPEVRIRIRQGVGTLRLEGPKRLTLKPAGGGLPRDLETPVTLAVGPEGVRITDAWGSAPSTGWNAFELIASADGQSRIKIDSSQYPGRIRIIPRRPARSGSIADGTADGRMDVVAVTGIEDYLVGVVASELYPDWKSPGVFQVQAVCARTYALHQRQRSIEANQEWDLESTEEDQAYKGGSVKVEAQRGVQDTRGVVLTWSGRLLRTYYSSTCGGRTASAADVWPTGPGYEFNLAAPIQARPREAVCQASPRYRWEATRDREALSRQMREFGKARNHPIANIGLFKSLEVERVNRDNRPASFVVMDTSGQRFPISAEQLRLACNYRGPGVPPPRDSLVRSGDLEMELKGTNVVIRGRGFGHGVGMCQFCAKAMADRGDSWLDMVAKFYPGATVERAY